MSARLGVSRSIEGYARKLEGEVNVQHPARIWVERQENKSVADEPGRLPTASECGPTAASCHGMEAGNRGGS